MQCKDGEGGGRAVACSRTIYTSSDGQTHASCTFGHCHEARAHSMLKLATQHTRQPKQRARTPASFSFHVLARTHAAACWSKTGSSASLEKGCSKSSLHPASSSSRASSGKSSIKIIRRVGEEGHDVGRSRQDGGRRVGGGQQASEAGEAWRRLEGMAGRREARLGWEATMCKFTPTVCHWGVGSRKLGSEGSSLVTQSVDR